MGFLHFVDSCRFIFRWWQEVAKRASEFASAGRHAVRLAGAEGEPQEAEEVKEKPKTREIKWRQGDMEFEAYMRMLDNSVRL